MEGPSVETEAAPLSADEKVAEFENFMFPEEDEEQQEIEEAADEGDDLDVEEGEADEPESVIEAPVSLNAEEKEVFAQLPPEAQQAWAASETRRNAQVQEATTKAAERERAAQTAAQSADAHAQSIYAAQLKAFIEPFRPTAPDPQLAQVDPASYIAADARYRAESAQFEAIEQQVAEIRNNAVGRAQQIDQESRAADLLTVPKLADPATRDSYIQESLNLVKELGLSPEAFEQVAGSEDFRALEKAAEWKSKADKYDKAMAKQMQKVRAAKGRTLRPSGAPHDNSRASDSNKAWDRVRAAGNNKAAKDAAFADWLEASGNL